MKRKKHTIVLYYLYSYLILITVFLIVGTIAFFYVSNLFKDEVVVRNLMALKETSKLIDVQFNELDNKIANYSKDDDVDDLLNLKNPHADGKDIVRMREIISNLSKSKSENHLIDDIFLFSLENDIVLTNIGSYFDPKRIGEAFVYNGMDYLQWLDMIRNYKSPRLVLPLATINYKGYEERSITTVKAFFFSSLKNAKGFMAVFTSENKIKDLVKNADLVGKSQIIVLNSNNELLCNYYSTVPFTNDYTLFEDITESVSNMTICNKSYLVLKAESVQKSWRYIHIIPIEVINEGIAPIQRSFLIGAIICLVLSVIVSGFLAYDRSKPVTKIIDTLAQAEQENEGTGIKTLNNKINEILINNIRYKDKLKEQIPIVKMMFYKNLLSGDFGSRLDFEMSCSQIGFGYDSKRFYVLLMEIYTLKTHESNSVASFNSVFVLIEDLLSSRYEDKMHIYHNTYKRITLILEDNLGYGYEDLDRIMSDIHHIIFEELQVGVIIYGGTGIEDSYHIPNAYQEANEIQHFKLYNQIDRVIWYKDVISKQYDYYYPSQFEYQLLNHIKAGLKKNVIGLIEELKEENRINEGITCESMKQIFYAIRGLIIKLGSELKDDIQDIKKDSDTVIRILDHTYEYELYFAIVKRHLIKLCEAKKNMKTSHNEVLINSVIAYIHDNYQDNSIYLASIADRFNVTSVYLSSFFKQQTGVNFSDYLSKVRIEHAVNRMLNTNKNIKSIALECGYNSIGVFRKAFKRIHAISPSEYRRINKK